MASGMMKKATTIASAGYISARPMWRPRRETADATDETLASFTLAEASPLTPACRYFNTTRSYPSTMSVK